MRNTISALAALAVFLTAPVAAIASDRTDIIALAQAYNAAGLRNDKAAWVSYCTEDAIVVDHERPYLFRGPGACGAEWDALMVWGQEDHIGFKNFDQKLYGPKFIDVAGDNAYAVFPGKAWFTQNGRRQVEPFLATFVLRRQDGRWRIAGITWSSLGWGPVAASGR